MEGLSSMGLPCKAYKEAPSKKNIYIFLESIVAGLSIFEPKNTFFLLIKIPMFCRNFVDLAYKFSDEIMQVSFFSFFFTC